MPRRRVQRAERVKARSKLGPLGRRLVAPQTQVLYDAALCLFDESLKADGRKWPKNEQQLPPLLEKYAETLWQEGETKADLANLLSALELAEARLKQVTRSAWRLYGTWKKNEMQPRCTPAKMEWVRSLAGCALLRGWDKTAFVLMIIYDCLLRTAEGASLKMANFNVSADAQQGMLILSASKGQTRTGVQESMAIRKAKLVKWAAALKQLEKPGEPLIPGGACALRRQFRQLVRDTSLTHMDLQVYSLRRKAQQTCSENVPALT